MSENQTSKPSASDEIDLGVLFSKIRNGINRLFLALFHGLLAVYLYFKRNIYWLSGLVIFGALSGFAINTISGVKYQLNVIVTPNLDSKNYLYSMVADIQANIKAKDTLFFQDLDMDIERMRGFEVSINSLKTQNANALQQEIDFLNLLKEFPELEIPGEVLREIIDEQMSKDHNIRFYFKDTEIGSEYAKKLLDYVNSNPFYKKMDQVYTSNAELRIEQNKSLIKQIDSLIGNFTKKMLQQQPVTSGSLMLENQEPLNIPSLFSLKNELIRDNEAKTIELERREGVFTILSFGQPREADLILFEKAPIAIPIGLLTLFFLIGLIRFLDSKAMEVYTK
jgi:hypothetical protein